MATISSPEGLDNYVTARDELMSPPDPRPLAGLLKYAFTPNPDPFVVQWKCEPYMKPMTFPSSSNWSTSYFTYNASTPDPTAQ